MKAQINRSARTPQSRPVMSRIVGSRGQRVLSAQGHAGGWSQDELETASLEEEMLFNTALRSFDMVPPRPAVIAHGKVLRVVYELRAGTPHS
ncbi:hypothetical protein NLM33_28990 [Bradyrhizobium sp. CCGUVB1N3]|uniref:hypothetical protein n=1 Tax=Bradyrhizobium sp. CCGUVB1N3 TaxID=2949629 RepID=UPI0020B24D53|nr:hypothetical protein [Bradyrhizobium sp. CCGUVB1N3]MCP3474356.1 hypothetical protein [Bradyrhizobium sp. CCGUVB1N3]